MTPQGLQLPAGATLESDPATSLVTPQLPPGATLESGGASVAPADQSIIDDPTLKLLYTTKEGIPVYARSEYTQPQDSPLERFASNAWDYSIGGLLNLVKGVGSLAIQAPTHQIDPNSAGGQMLQGIIQSHEDQFQKAKTALQQGNHVEAFGHSLAAILPLLGPAAAHIGETLTGTDPVFDKYGNVVTPGKAPDVAAGLGQMFGLGLNYAAPKALPPMMDWTGRNTGFKSTLPAVQQEALAHLAQEGVPIQAGVRTGSKMLRALETSTAQMPYGTQAAGEFLTGQSQKMSELAGRIGEQIYPTPVEPFDIGEETGKALDKVIADLKGQEDPAYERAWKDARDPASVQKVQVGTRTVPASGLLDASGKPATGSTEVPIYKNIAQPVDISWLKPIAAQELPKLELQPAATQAQSAAASIFKKVLQLDDVVPAQYAEEMLKGFKEEAGYDVDPNARNYVQGLAGSFIPRLEDSIAGAVGPEAAESLRAGRRLHAEKQDVIALRKGMLKEPVQEFRNMVQSEDAGAKRLGQIAQYAPDLMPKLGRAWFDTTVDLASREGDWRNQGTIFNKYDKLGGRTKALMFPEPGLRQGLDRFFLGQKLTGIPVNPSGTALVAATQKAFTNPASFAYGLAHGYGGSKLFFTPRGIKLLLRAAENPPTTPAAAAAFRDEAQRIGGTPPTTPPAGGAGGGGRSPITISAPSYSDQLQTVADQAINRMRQRGTFSGAQAQMGISPADLKDIVQWGAAKIGQGIMDAPWRRSMVAQFGKFPKADLDDVYKRARDIELKRVKDWKPGMPLEDIHPLTHEIIPQKSGKLVVDDVQRYLQDRVRTAMGSLPADAPDRVKVQRMLSQARGEFNDQMTRPYSGLDWYGPDTRMGDEMLRPVFPELADSTNNTLQKAMSAAMSNNSNPQAEAFNGARIWQGRNENNGVFPAKQPSGKNWPAQGIQFQIAKLNNLIGQLGEKGAADFLRDSVTGREIKQFAKSAKVRLNDRYPGSLLLGPKIGRYFNDLMDVPQEGSTVDLWDMRRQGRQLGTLLDSKGKAIEAPRTEGERANAMQVHSRLADETGIAPRDAQSVLWHYEQELYRRLGLKVRSYRRSQGIQQYLDSLAPPQ